jgi:NTP pyrophosphatase (non-canonical NTP hydrolase)
MNGAELDPQATSASTQAAVIQDMQERVLEVNKANGWFDDDRRFGEDIALLHSEVSEMLEAYRDHGVSDMTAGLLRNGDPAKPEGVGSEAADVLVRLLDTCERYDIDLSSEFNRKLAYNTTRGYKHGGKNL